MALEFPEDRHPNREEARKLLRACDNKFEHIEQWNEYRKNNERWNPDLSDEDDRADFMEVTLCYADDKGEWHGVNLRHANLSGAGLYGAILKGVDFDNAKLIEARLDTANLSGAKLFGANLTRVTLDDANLSGANLEFTDLTEASLVGTTLRGADLFGVDLKGGRLFEADLVGANLTKADLSDAGVAGVMYDGAGLKGKCQGIRMATCYGNPLFKRDVEDQDYIETLREGLRNTRGLLDNEAKDPCRDRSPRRRWNHFKRRFGNRCALGLFRIWGWIDYGRSLTRVGVVATGVAIAFGIFFCLDQRYLWGYVNFEGSADSWFTPFYYSIVTYTTLGFGDVTPNHWIGEIVVTLEVIFGYLTLGLLVSILANKVARRS